MKQRILCIEDERDLREDLSCDLREAGYDVSEASNGMEGLALAMAEHFDLVLCDLQLPGLNGLDLLRKLRSSGSAHSCVPVVLLSAYGDAELRQHAREMHATALLLKPVDYDDLLTLVDKVVDEAGSVA